MKDNLTELVFILDKSGSMGGLEADTIGGFNSMIKKQKEEEGEAIISTVLFDNTTEVLHNRKNVKEIKELTDKDYQVGGCTALLDALGRAIKHINKVQKEMPEDERPAKTMFIITTDGQENSSREFSYEKIKQMVKKKQEKKNWEFLFIGANMDAIGEAGNIGIRADRAVRYECDAQGTAVHYRALGNAISSFRRCAAGGAGADAALTGWSDEISKDYESRKR